MSAEIVSLVDWRETRNSKAALARWARRLRKQLEENMAVEQSGASAKATDNQPRG
ncbi:hypothetical protein CO731_01497 [Aminobacter sp. MSH1]|uniref:hypothetical protein n=1 Tax=Aminobacter sp. MSH1 TaxID=374606 RepID=UPI000D505DD3|nr:hypothetical protein [Aminobacter sp. MSH1]AWC22041.1 hypothetical protein CO731_01497 [Aminobacter sp. MSH1]